MAGMNEIGVEIVRQDVLPLTNDLVFKVVYGQDKPESKRALIALLNLILERGDRLIKSVEILNPLMITDYIRTKGSSVDIMARTSEGELVNIEMQNQSEGDDYIGRSLFYVGKVLQLTLSRGEKYDTMKPVKVISLLAEPLFPDRAYYHSTYVLKERCDNRELTELLQIDYLEMSKIDPEKKPIEEMNELEQFCLYAYHVGKKSEKSLRYTEQVLQLGGEAVRMAHEVLITVTDEERAYVEAMMRDKFERDETNRRLKMEEAAEKRGLERGLKRGLEQGLEQGLKQGLERGMERGLERGQKIGEKRGEKRGEQIGLKRGKEQINELFRRLLAEQRLEDLERSTTDAEFQQQLLEEYGL